MCGNHAEVFPAVPEKHKRLKSPVPHKIQGERDCKDYEKKPVENRIFQAVPLFLYKRFEDPLSLNRDLFYPGLLLFVKTKCQHIAFVQMIEIQIINKLFFTGFVIFFSSP